MSSTQLKLIAPLDAPLPPPRAGEILTDAQWQTLMAIADTLIPSVESSSKPSLDHLNVPTLDHANAIQSLQRRLPANSDTDLATRFLSEKPSLIPDFPIYAARVLAECLNEDAKKGIRVILTALDTRAGCLLMTGYTTSFHSQPVNVRHAILQGWGSSYLPPLRNALAALTGLLTTIWLRTSPTHSQILGVPRSPVHGRPGKGFDYEFIQFPASDSGPEVLQTDVVIVGSGCGGGVCAKNLAEAGFGVIVLEKAYHWGPEYLPMSEKDGPVHLFDNSGLQASDSGSIACISGRAWGGGGTVNWSASLQTQGFVRKEWSSQGLPFFTSSEYQKCLDRVCDRMGVSTDHIEHNPNNRFLAEGARKIGYSHKVVPQNTGGNKHYCGYCTLGCGAAEKQGPVVSFLPDAARAGARFIEGFEVDRVTFDSVDGTKTATGVEGTWVSRDTTGGVSGAGQTTRTVVIKAKRVILSAGTFHSPMILLRSGLRNPQIGRNLHLHPATLVTAVYPDLPEPINPWEGGILTQLVDEFQNLDGHGHGVKLEPMTMLPSWVLTMQAWKGGLEYKELCSKLAHMTSHLVLVRDRDTGRVYPDPTDGRCRLDYPVSAFDRKHALEGICAAAKIAYVQGAREIYLSHTGVPAFIRPASAPAMPSPPAAEESDPEPEPSINDPAFTAWLDLLRRTGLPSPETSWGSAHQMGTCRMSAHPKRGVVNPQGRVWGTEGLYVADASVFPSASGVNPMVTNMAISDWISRGVARELREAEQGGRRRKKGTEEVGARL